MSQLSVIETEIETDVSKQPADWTLLVLPAAALAIDIFAPMFIAYGILPEPVRWISDLAVLTMIGLLILYMLANDRFPMALLLVLAVTIIWSAVAVISGQGVSATAWGWYLMFKYPLVAVFFYLVPRLPLSIPRLLPKICVALMAVQVVVQVGQFQSGVEIGDQLSGTFGSYGTSQLAVFSLFTVALTIGWWLVRNDWKPFLLTLALVSVSSVLGEMKVFPLIIAQMGIIVLVIIVLRRGQFTRIVQIVLVAIVTIVSYAFLFNRFVPNLIGGSALEGYLDPDLFWRYMNNSNQVTIGGGYDLGRFFSLRYGYSTLLGDPTTTLFGLGLGARGTSAAIGVQGYSIGSSIYNAAYSSLVVMMQELGFIGLLLLAAVLLWLAFQLYRGTLPEPQTDLDILRYGLLIFTLLLPFFLWYTTVWTTRVPMLLYWVSVGYVYNRDVVSRYALLASEQARSDS